MTTLKIKDADGATKHIATTGTGTADDPLKTQQSITGTVEVTAMPPLSVGEINVEVGEVAVSNFPTSFQISNLPATQVIAGNVSVSNFPTSFQVSNFPSGFQVTNFPATQTIAGSVAVSNFPTSFQISNFPTSFQVSNFPNTQTIAGTVDLGTTGSFATNFGLQADAVAASDTDTTSFLGLFKRLLQRVSTLITSVGLDTTLQSIRDRLPATLGVKTAANSLPVTLSSDGAFATNFGAIADSAATTDAGSFSLIALFKRLLSVALAKGQAAMASSISVAIASNQSAVPISFPASQLTPTFENKTTSGTITAGKYSVSFYNSGSAAGTLLGAPFPVGAGISYTPPPGMTLSAIAYDATGTTFLVGTL